MTPWHSDARLWAAVGGASSDLAKGGHTESSSVGSALFPTIGVEHSLGNDSPRSGTPGSDHVSELETRWMPNTVERRVCVVVASSGIDLTLARIGRKSARPYGGTIAPQYPRRQTPSSGRTCDLYVRSRPSRFASHTTVASGPRLGGKRCTEATHGLGLAFLVRVQGAPRGVRSASLGAR